MVRNFPFLVLLIVFLPFCGCETKKKTPEINKSEPEAITYINDKLPPDSAFLKKSHVPKAYGKKLFFKISIQEFPEFWEAFGKSLRAKDYTKLDYYIIEKLYIEGHEDHDPKFTLAGKKRIDKVLEIYETGGFYDLESDKPLGNDELFKRKAEENRYYKKGADMQWIEEFIFENKGSGWELISVFCDTRNK